MPRPFVADTGLPETESFPYPARESGRQLGLYGSAVIWTKTSESDDGGGDVTGENWTPADEAVDARLDDMSGAGVSGGASMSEDTTHIVTFRDGQPLTTLQRVAIEGSMWAVTAIRETTDELVVRAEVMKL